MFEGKRGHNLARGENVGLIGRFARGISCARFEISLLRFSNASPRFDDRAIQLSRTIMQKSRACSCK
jgi:hypothetical protein